MDARTRPGSPRLSTVGASTKARLLTWVYRCFDRPPHLEDRSTGIVNHCTLQ